MPLLIIIFFIDLREASWAIIGQRDYCSDKCTERREWGGVTAAFERGFEGGFEPGLPMCQSNALTIQPSLGLS